MGDNDLYEGKVITDTDGNQYMAKKIGGEYALKLIWKAPKGPEPKKSKLEKNVEWARTTRDEGYDGPPFDDGPGPDYGG